jgi:ribosomal protein L28
VARLPRRRTTRVWKPNVFNKSFFSEVLGRKCVWSHGNAAELTLSFSLRHTPVSSPHAHRACVRVPIKVTARAIRCIDKAGGFDNYILNTKVQAVKGRGRRDDGTTG